MLINRIPIINRTRDFFTEVIGSTILNKKIKAMFNPKAIINNNPPEKAIRRLESKFKSRTYSIVKKKRDIAIEKEILKRINSRMGSFVFIEQI